jgi:hypothetical protein
MATFGIYFASSQYPPDRPLIWGNFFVALGIIGLKYLLLLAVTFLLSVRSTSFFLPIFGTFSIYMAGHASFDVHQYVIHNPERYRSIFVFLIKILHYLLPNLSAFDFQVYAIYALPLPLKEVLFVVLYGVGYTGIIFLMACLLFQRREL